MESISWQIPVVKPYFKVKRVLSKKGEQYFCINFLNGKIYEISPVGYKIIKDCNGLKSIQEFQNTYPNAKQFIRGLIKNDIVYLLPNKTKIKKIKIFSIKKQNLDTITLEITGQCNLRCKHCYNTKFRIGNKNILSKIDNLLKDFKRLGVRRIRISGGECLLEKSLFDIFDEITEKELFLGSISTNATLIDQKTAGKLRQYFSRNGYIFVSLDGPDASSHDKLRGRGTFEKAIKGIEYLNKNNCRIIINSIVHRYNIEKLVQFYNFLRRNRNIKGWRVGIAKPIGEYKENFPEFEVDFTTVIQKFILILQKWFKESPSSRMSIELADFFKTSILEKGFIAHHSIDHPCEYNRDQCTIIPDGGIVFCDLFQNMQFGNIFKESFEKIWGRSNTHNFLKLKIEDIEECKKCRYLKICGTGCRANPLFLFGNIFSRDLYACMSMRYLEKELVKLFPEKLKSQYKRLINQKGFIPEVPYKLNLLEFQNKIT